VAQVVKHLPSTRKTTPLPQKQQQKTKILKSR
jgi:hypothetical protein